VKGLKSSIYDGDGCQMPQPAQMPTECIGTSKNATYIIFHHNSLFHFINPTPYCLSNSSMLTRA
jgi:hypothetical protein